MHYPFATLDLPLPSPSCRLTVTIPAKDEADYIHHTLEALRQQYRPDGTPVPPEQYQLIVLANNCRDATADRCRAYAARHPSFQLRVAEVTLPPELACVGTARRLLMDTAHEQFVRLDRPTGIICSTDADTLPDRHWVHYNLAAMANGARAVGGRIVVPAGDRHAMGHYRKNHLQDVTYRSLQYCLESILDPLVADPWPRHFQHFGPSTAVRADAYAACGGIPPLKSLEDVGLVRALERIDVPVTHDLRVRVTTSARFSDRVGGKCFSSQLDEWAAMEHEREVQRVIGLKNCIRLFKWKVALRRAFGERRPQRNCPRLIQLSRQLNWSPRQLDLRISTSSTFGALYQDIRLRLENCPEFAGAPIGRAIRDLRRFTHSRRHCSVGTHPGDSGQPARVG